MAEVNARERVRQRLRQFMADKGLTGRALAGKLQCSEQWVSNLLSGRTAIPLKKLDAIALHVGVAPSQLVRSDDDELWELRPTEMRLVRAVRELPPSIRDHMVLTIEFMVGAMPAEIDFLTAYRKLTPEDQLRVQQGVGLMLASSSAGSKTERNQTQPGTDDRLRRGARVVPRLKHG